jgi:hypothetical protein
MAKIYIVNGERVGSVGVKTKVYMPGQEFPVDGIDPGALKLLIDDQCIIEVDSKTLNPNIGEVIMATAEIEIMEAAKAAVSAKEVSPKKG